MVIVKKELKTFIEHAVCECGGELIAEETAIFGALLFGGKDPAIEHKCKNCGKTSYFAKPYQNTEQQEA